MKTILLFLFLFSSTSSSVIEERSVCGDFVEAACDLSEDNIIDYDRHTETPEECQGICRENPQCFWFTHFSTQCYILVQCGRGEHCEGCVSGPKDAPDFDTCPWPPVTTPVPPVSTTTATTSTSTSTSTTTRTTSTSTTTRTTSTSTTTRPSGNTCDDCTAVVTVLAYALVSDESIADQQAILVGGLCPTSENPFECWAGLPSLWKAIALTLWPGYYDPSAEWMCGPTCAAPEDVDMTCDGCVAGIQASIDQLLSAEAMDLVVDGFVNSDFCDQVGGDERCPDILDAVLRQGLPLLAAASNPDDFKAACNAAKPGTCAARKMTIF